MHGEFILGGYVQQLNFHNLHQIPGHVDTLDLIEIHVCAGCKSRKFQDDFFFHIPTLYKSDLCTSWLSD